MTCPLAASVKQTAPKMGVNIVAGNNRAGSAVKVYGEDVHVITDDEIQMFGLNEKNLKSAVDAELGKAPSDAFVRSPTPWDDLYKRYSWKQVHFHLKPVRAQILSVRTNPVIVKKQRFSNNSGKKATYGVSISTAVSNTVSSSWSQSNSVAVSYGVEITAEVAGSGAAVSSGIEFSTEWGRE